MADNPAAAGGVVCHRASRAKWSGFLTRDLWSDVDTAITPDNGAQTGTSRCKKRWITQFAISGPVTEIRRHVQHP